MFFESSLGKIYYAKVGTGPHLCFLHGFCENGSIWDHQVKELSKNYSCLLVDLPGFGKSENKGFQSISQLSKAIIELLYHLDHTECTLLGHSMGGYVAAAMFQEKPELFNAIAFIHSTTYSDTEAKIDSRNKVIEFVNKHGAEPFLQQFYPNLVSVENLEDLRHVLWDAVKDTKAESIMQATSAMRDRKDTSEVIASSNIPVLFLCGAKDQHIPLRDIYTQASKCQTAQLNVLSRSGHLSLLEQPELATSKIKEFLKFTADLNA